MKIVPKLVMALLAGIWSILAVSGYVRVRREIALFDDDMRRDHSLIGRGVGAAFVDTWQHDGRPRAEQLLEEASPASGLIALRWLDDTALPAGIEPPTEGTRIGAPVHRIEPGVHMEDSLVTWVPIRIEGGSSGALRVRESLDQQKTYVRTTLRDSVLVTLLMAAAASVLATTLGVALLGAPMRALVDQARRIGAGDLSQRVTLRRHDEMGVLAQEMNRMSAQLEQAQQNLSAETAARINALEQLRHADRLMTVGKLASGIAHELGTPLNVVSGRARMIVMGRVTETESVQCAQAICDQAERMATILRQLLDFARHGPTAKSVVDLRTLACATLGLLQPMAAKRQVTLKVETDEPAHAAVNAGQMQQVLTNLIVNAIHAMPNGGEVRVALTRGDFLNPEAAPRAAALGSASPCVRMTVSDEGVGIPAQELARVFEPFFTTKGVGEGTGLGLSVSYGIVRDHGGWISVASSATSGTQFSVYVPVE